MTAKLLIVDDDEIIRSVTREGLELCGYTVETAEDGLAAWEKIDSDPSRFDLMLLDKQMPRLDGIALLKRIKSDARFKDLPVIMLTVDNRQEDIAEGLAEGAFYYLTKPSTEDVLKLVIGNTLDEFRQKRELRALVGKQANNLNLLRRADFCYRSLSEARDLALLLADASMTPERTVNGYSELLINAVEHGNLEISYAEKGRLLSEGRWVEEVEARLQRPQYSAKVVNVTLEKTAVASIVTITDQGNGFNWQAYVEFSPERAFDLHGRGIAMSKATSFDNLEYLGNGSSVVTTVLNRDAGMTTETNAAIGATILIVDDSPENLYVLSELLRLQYRVLAASSGEEGLRVAGSQPKPDLVLLDVMMPGMDGYEVLDRLREDPATRDIPVIFLTSMTDAEDEERGLKLGAVDYITKPIKPVVVQARIRAQLEAKRARDWMNDQNAVLETEVARLEYLGNGSSEATTVLSRNAGMNTYPAGKPR